MTGQQIAIDVLDRANNWNRFTDPRERKPISFYQEIARTIAIPRATVAVGEHFAQITINVSDREAWQTRSVIGPADFRVTFQKNLPMVLDKAEFVAFIHGLWRGIAIHEADEFFIVAGERVFDPHCRAQREKQIDHDILFIDNQDCRIYNEADLKAEVERNRREREHSRYGAFGPALRYDPNDMRAAVPFPDPRRF